MAAPISFGFGALRNGRVYGDRDFLGAEEPAQTISDYTGFNEVARLTRDVRADMDNEHFPNGVHDTPKIHRALVGLLWSSRTSSYSPSSICYSQDGAGVVKRGASVFASIVRNAAGDVTLTFAEPFPTDVLSLWSMTPGGGATFSTISRTWLYAVLDPQTIRVFRRQWPAAGSTSIAFTDGDMWFGIGHAVNGTGTDGIRAVPDVLSADCAPTDEHWKLVRGAYRSWRPALGAQHAYDGKHRTPQIAAALGIFAPASEDGAAMAGVVYAGSFPSRPRLYERGGAAGFYADVRFRRPMHMLHVSIMAESTWSNAESLRAAQCAAYPLAEESDRTLWRCEIGGMTEKPEAVRIVAFGGPRPMGNALAEFDHALEAETTITPDALAPWATYSDEYLARFGNKHTPAGEHNDPLVPVAWAHVAADGSTIDAVNVTVTKPATGRYHYQLDFSMDTTSSWCALAWPVTTDGSTQAEFPVESSRSFAKTPSQTEVEIFNQSATLVDREHVVCFYGIKDGGL